MALNFEHDEFIEVVIRRLDALDVEYMLAGSWATSIYGEPRQTLDVDIVINPRADQVEPLCHLFPEEEDFYVSIDAAKKAVQTRHQFNVLHPPTGNKIDFILSGNDDWGRLQIKRRRRVFITPNVEGYACSPEDVIIAKMIYHREGRSEKHINDTAKVLCRSGDLIDRAYIEEWATKLKLLNEWNMILKRVAEG